MAALPDSFLLELKYRADIEQLIGGYLQLKRRGRNLTGLCPFHSEKTPSFTVYPENQSFYCFGCGSGGDAISFVRKAENLDYMEAVRFLAQRVGMEMPQQADDDGSHKRRLRILEMNRDAARFFHQTLMSPAGKAARGYLVSRGLTKQTVTRFGLGLAPESWDALTGHLQRKGYTQEELVAGCLGMQRKGGGVYDAFRNRIIFPIIDLRGSVIAFGGRNLGDQGPKYLNSSDTPVYKKSRNLFALNLAKNSGRSEIILAEGYMDVVAIHQGGFSNAVATLGTALTGEQARLLAQYTQQVVLAYDSDEAGQRATRRASAILDEAGVGVRVLALTGAKDPDEYIRTYGSDKFEYLLAGSENATEFAITQLRNKHNLDLAEGRVAFLQGFVQLMADIPSTIQREVYLSKICRELEVDKQAVAAQLASALKRKQQTAKKRDAAQLRPFTTAGPGGSRTELERQKYPRQVLAGEGLLAYLMKHPENWSWLREQVADDDFLSPGDRELYRAILGKLSQGHEAQVTTLGAVLPEELISRLMEITTKEVYRDQSRTDAEALVRVLREHRSQKTKEELSRLEGQALQQYIEEQASHKK